MEPSTASIRIPLNKFKIGMLRPLHNAQMWMQFKAQPHRACRQHMAKG